MNWIFITLLILGYTTSLRNVNRNDTEGYNRIINGREVDPPFRYPWMAAIQRNRSPYCGGVFIEDDVIITAAHCSKSGSNKEFRVLAHRHNIRKSSRAEDGYALRVLKRVVHSKYDIAIWFLDNGQGFRLSQFVSVEASRTNSHDSNVLATALGWGWLRTDGPLSDTLQQVDVPVITGSKCQHIWHKRGVNFDPRTQICAGWAQGKRDTCKGDSGGPLFVTTEHGSPILLGLTSFGEPCAKPQAPTVYVKVSYFVDWIDRVLEHHNRSARPSPFRRPK